MPIRRNLTTIVTLLSIGLISHSGFTEPASATSRSAKTTSTKRTFRVTASAEVDFSKLTDIVDKCSAANICLRTSFFTTPITGDISGTETGASAAAASSKGPPAIISGEIMIDGTVKGCGTGEFVLAYRPTYIDPSIPVTYDQNGNQTSGGARGEIIRMFRSGDLSDIEGEFSLILKSAGPVSNLTLTGTVRCTPH